jgi:hypothetical protein
VAIWIAVLNISDRTAAKVQGKHGVSRPDILDALVAVEGLPYRWDNDPERGLRAIVTVRIGDRDYAIVVYPIGDDVWNLGSAYRI